MSFIEDVPGFQAGLSDVLGLVGIEQNDSIAAEITRLYSEADSLAVFSVKSIVALYWWAAHIASATADALGYAQEIQAESKTANQDQLKIWTTYLGIKRPAEIQRVYIRTTKQIDVTRRIVQKVNSKELAKLAKEVAALEAWKKKTVTPDLSKLLAFLAAWNKTYKAPVVRWVAWFKAPSQFAQWAAMPLVSQLPTTLSEAAAHVKATAIEAALVNTWSSDSGTIWDSVSQWLVTDT